MTKRRVPIDLRLFLPRLAAAATVAAWLWFYADSVGALIQQEQIESKFQDIQIPAGEKYWVILPAFDSTGTTDPNPDAKSPACRGTISTELKKSERQRPAAESSAGLNEPGSSPLPAKPEQITEKISIFSINGRLWVDLLGRPFPAVFQGSGTFDENYRLTEISGVLQAGRVKIEVTTTAELPLTFAAQIGVNGSTTLSSYTLDAPIFLILNRAGDGTIKLPLEFRNALQSIIPHGAGNTPAEAGLSEPFAGNAPIHAPFRLVPADLGEKNTCQDRFDKLAADFEKQDQLTPATGAGSQAAIDLNGLTKTAVPKLPASSN